VKTVSFQGAQISAGQRRILEQQRQVLAAMKPVLVQQVAETIAALESRKEQGARPMSIWTLDYESQGTVSLAEWMGF
jgi:hypothetical protein